MALFLLRSEYGPLIECLLYQELQETSSFDPNNALLRWLLLFFIGEMPETWPRSHHYLMPETN